MNKRYLHTLAALTVFLGAASLPAQAQVEGRMTQDNIDARHDAAKEQCKTMEGEQKDLCLKQAKAEKETAEAQAKADKKKAEADHDAAKARNEADYEVARKKCDTLSGDAKDACQADAKTQHGK